MIDATLGHIPNLSGSFGRGWFVQAVLIDDMSHCYDIFGLRHVMLDVILGHTPLTSPLLSSVQVFRLRLYMDKMFRLHLHHICYHSRSDVQASSFAISGVQRIRCSDFICITFSSTVYQTFRLRLLHIRRSDFAFIWIRCSYFICIMFASTAGQTFRLRLLHIRHSDFAFIWIRCSDFICITFSSLAD